VQPKGYATDVRLSIVLPLLLSAMAHSQTPKGTVLDGIYSGEQAERGQIGLLRLPYDDRPRAFIGITA
jgi:hypothetical protein